MSRLPPENRLVALRLSGCFVAGALFVTLCLIPYFLFDLAQSALQNIHLTPQGAVLVIIGLILGSPINIPIARFPLDEDIMVPVFEPIGGWVPFARYRRLRREAVVAVNLGGCVIPVLLALWLTRHLLQGGFYVVQLLLWGSLANIIVCYIQAVPVPGLGIRLNVFLSALISLSVAWLGLSGEQYEVYRAPLAYVVGVMGPLVGADLLHWRDFRKLATGTISIGGAGTWDGIVLSGLTAALLA